MKEYLLRMARYNSWANNKFIEPLTQADESMIDKVIESSFPSLRGTVYHIYSAEFIWLQRLELVEKPQAIQHSITVPFNEACKDWQMVSGKLQEFIQRQFDNSSFDHVFEYYNIRKEHCKMPVGVALQHVFNHSTYHRGQLVTMMRQAGFAKIPNTDLASYVLL